ncbi:MAG: hypothetical protein HZC04_00200 [Candidatus Lloydbacteria bacterium]|nr:hypothetical protein [Candidatus Lloydbacteria bacterium]
MLPDYENLIDATNKDEDRVLPAVKWGGIISIIPLYILTIAIVIPCAIVLAVCIALLMFAGKLADTIDRIEAALDWKLFG